jgi:RNA polymerase-binding transcription factor DksA
MAHKPFTHDRLSNKLCIGCGKRIKRNLLHRKPDAKFCYSCFKTAQLKHQRREGHVV